jgi:lipopolysaccharide transport system permease protein
MSDVTQVITPHQKLWSVDFREIWRYRDLIALFVKRNIVVQYKQTILGPLWYIIQPLLTVIMNMVVFGGIAKMSTDGLPQAVFYMAGNVCWFYFADCLNQTSSTFRTNQAMFGKVYFPRLVVPIATVISNLLRFGIQIGLFVALYLYFFFSGADIHLGFLIVDLPVAVPAFVLVLVNVLVLILVLVLLVVMLAGLGLGFGILVSSMTTKYRDLSILFTFIVQLWMYATPIVYPISTVPEGTLRTLIMINPMSSVIEAFKYITLGQGYFSWLYLAYSFTFMVVLLVLGIVIFNKVQRSFMDTV